MPQLRLLTIRISHYCEKARWALDRLGLAYHEERHLQVFHYLRSYQLSRGPNVPVLIDGDRSVTDSTAIMQYLDRYATAETCLYPEQQRERIEELEELFDETLGIESRRWVYFHAMQEPRSALRTSSQGVPVWQAAIAPLCYPLLPALGGLMDNRQVLVPFLNLRMLGRRFADESYQYHQLGLMLDARDPQDRVFGW